MSAFASVLENEAKQKVLKQILANSKKHDIKIIAERIETELMFKLAKSLDIEFLQGYYIGKPKKYYTHK
jgi:EAL domain-containing protein (putative c-di-GMP-specific phosphodiesterase class I)